MPAVSDTIRVEGLRELHRAFRVADKEQARELRTTLRRVGEPVRAEAEGLAAVGIRRMTLPWSRMRLGVTQTSVYVAPRKKGTRDSRRKRTNLAGLLLDRAMLPALERNQPRVLREFEEMLTDMGRKWERV